MIAFSDTVSARREDGVLVVTLDNPPVNALGHNVRLGLVAALDRAEAEADIAGIVLTGAGKTFCGGADIREFGAEPRAPWLPEILSRMETFAKPIVAAINGVALGGGLELALACHHRIAAPGAKVGLPEVKLGIIPGGGGTQRLPRLIGIAAALDMITEARQVTAEEALRLGIVDAVAADAVAEAIAAARRLIGPDIRRTGLLPRPALPADVETRTQRILARARGQSAIAEAIRLVRGAADWPIDAGLEEERQAFLTLRAGDQSKALRHVFFAERAAAKVEGLEGVTPRKVETLGIVGLGLMGSGIAYAALSAGLTVIGVDMSGEAAEAGRGRIEALIGRSVTTGRITPDAADVLRARLTVAADLAALGPADLVIEAVFDDLTVKSRLFADLDRVLRPQTIIATNTSYLNPDALAAGLADPSRVIGLHFFSPAHVMRLLEIVRCARAAPDVLATGLALAKRLGKLPVVAGVCEGFIGNRMFSAYRMAAERLVLEGASPDQIDRAMEAYGFAMGPFAVFDLAGLEIAWARRKRQAAAGHPVHSPIADRLCEAGRFGQKTGRGWYDHSSGQRAVDPAVTAIIDAARAAAGVTPRAFTDSDIAGRLVAALAEEGRQVLAEGIAARASDIDLVFVNGYGFPAYRGGPMFATGAGA